MKLLPSRPNTRVFAEVLFGLRSMPNSELWAGILVSHQWVIDSIVAEEHVALQIGGEQVIEVDVEASDEYEEARITCRNLLFGTGGTKN